MIMCAPTPEQTAKQFPLGCTIMRRDRLAGLRYRVVAYTMHLDRLALTVERCDGFPCLWRGARVPVYRDTVMAGLVEVVS